MTLEALLNLPTLALIAYLRDPDFPTCAFVERRLIDPEDSSKIRAVESTAVDALIRNILDEGFDTTRSPMLLYRKPQGPLGALRYKFGLVDGQHRNVALDELEAHPERYPAFEPVTQVYANILRADSPRALLRSLGNRENRTTQTVAKGSNLWSTLSSVLGMTREAAAIGGGNIRKTFYGSTKSAIPAVANPGTFRNYFTILKLPQACLLKIRDACQKETVWENDRAQRQANGTLRSLRPRPFKVQWTVISVGKVVNDHDADSDQAKDIWLQKCISPDRDRPTRDTSHAFYLKAKKRVQRLKLVDARVSEGTIDLKAAERVRSEIRSGVLDLRTNTEFDQLFNFGSTGSLHDLESEPVPSSQSASAPPLVPVLPDDVVPLLQVELGDFADLMGKKPDMNARLVLTDPPYGTTANAWDHVLSGDKVS
jgi:hypothetical protein